jgi:hypothetical protein
METEKTGSRSTLHHPTPDAVSPNGHGPTPQPYRAQVGHYPRAVHPNGHTSIRATALSTNDHPPKVRLPFSPAFQTKILRLCLEDPAWLSQLKPLYFDHPLDGRVLEVMQRLHATSALSRLTLVDACKQDLGTAAARNVLTPILKKPLCEKDRAYLHSELPRFTRYQSIGEELVEASRRYQARDFPGLVKAVMRAAEPAPSEARIALTRMTDVKTKAYQWDWREHIAERCAHSERVCTNPQGCRASSASQPTLVAAHVCHAAPAEW